MRRGWRLRAAKKCNKYDHLCAGVSSSFVAGVIERRGTVCDGLVGLIKRLGGDQDREPGQHDDYVFSTRSKTSYMAGRMCFATVIADAFMVDTIIGIDTRHDDDEQRPSGRSRNGYIPHPTRQDIEGRGGQTAFEAVGQGRR